jgi:hypothetical protein
MRLIARPASASPSTTNPVTPWSITSGTDPRRNATTGVPHAIASITTRPKGSGQSIGNSRAVAFARKSCFLPSLAQQGHFTDKDRNRCTAPVGSKHICANPPLDYKPWLSKTFLHAEPSFPRFCCKHCWTELSSPNTFRQSREASREQACCSCGVPLRSLCAIAVGHPNDSSNAITTTRMFIRCLLCSRERRVTIKDRAAREATLLKLKVTSSFNDVDNFMRARAKDNVFAADDYEVISTPFRIDFNNPGRKRMEAH